MATKTREIQCNMEIAQKIVVHFTDLKCFLSSLSLNNTIQGQHLTLSTGSPNTLILVISWSPAPY